MGSKFETRLLGELCHEITVGFVGTMTNEYIENGIPFLRSKILRSMMLNGMT